MKELTYQDLEDNGIDTSMISVCAKLRRLAKLERLSLDMTEHRSGLNRHLFDYIAYCDRDVLDYIREYLSNLQPYMIERRKDQEAKKSFICVIDNLYRVSVYIKADTTQFQEAVISFHEDNKRGIAKTNNLIRYSSHNQELVPIFADSILGKSENENIYEVNGFFQRGMKTFPIVLRGAKCQDVFLVSKKAIDNEFIGYCNDYIRDLYTSDLELDFDKIEVFSMLQQISFASYGRDTFSSVSLLIDSLTAQNGYASRSVADFALTTFVQNLSLTKEQQEELKNLLDEKFKVTSIRGIDTILQRIKDNLSLVYNQKELEKEEKEIFAPSAETVIGGKEDLNNNIKKKTPEKKTAKEERGEYRKTIKNCPIYYKNGEYHLYKNDKLVGKDKDMNAMVILANKLHRKQSL